MPERMDRVARAAMSRFQGRWKDYWPYFGFALLGIALAVWEGSVYHNKTTGTVVLAHVDDCQVDPVKGVDTTCTGTWPVGRAVPAAPQRSHGTIDGVDIPDIGRTVQVRVHGGTAYAHARLVAPAVFFFVGLLFALGWTYAAWRNAGASRPRPVAASGLPSG
jgi:hypothetical protein